MKKIVMLAVSLVYFTACGGGNSSSSPKTKGPLSRLTDRPQGFINPQRYSIVATPAKGLPMMCSTAKGFIVITNNMVTGTIISAMKMPLIISGTYVPETGIIEGGFTKAEQEFAHYTGKINLEQGSGNWSDDFGCKGTWKAIKEK